MENPVKKAQKATELQLSMLAAKTSPLTPLVQETLEKIFHELAERAITANNNEICLFTEKLIQVAQLIDPALRQNQFFFGENSHHPYAVQIPARDLLALYAARASMNSLPEYLRGTGAYPE